MEQCDQGEGGVSMEWQPIETAPRDGKFILTWDGYNIHIAEFAWDQTWAIVEDGERHKPTRWMPLPDPPEEE